MGDASDSSLWANLDAQGPLLVRLENDAAWVSVAIPAPCGPGCACVSLTLTVVEHDPDQKDTEPLVVPVLVTFPLKFLA